MTHDIHAPVTAADLLAHRAWVRAVARRLVRDESDADDLAQDALVTALERPPRDRDALRPWFRRVLQNRARDRHRSAGRRTVHEQRAPVSASPATPAELAATADAHRLVIDTVMELDDVDRDLVLLRYFEGLTPAEIATRRGIPASTVRTRLHRALARLRGRLDARKGGDRGAWTLALFPLLGPDDPGSADVGRATSSSLVGAPAAAVGLAVVAALGLLWWLADGRFDGAGDARGDAAETAAADAGSGTAPGRAPRERVRMDRDTTGSAAAHDVASPPESTVAELSPEEVGTAAVSLRVHVTSEDRPVAGAIVRLFSLPDDGKTGNSIGWSELAAARTDAKGDATIAGPSGTVVLVRAESGELVAFHPPFRVPASGSDIAADLELETSVTLRGRVVDGAENPIAGARFVARVDLANESNLTRMAVAGPDGRFELPLVPVSTIAQIVTYEVFAAGFVDGWGAVNEETDLAAPIVVRLQGAAAVTGRCIDATGRPVPEVYVSWNDQKGVDTDAEGRFRLGGLPREKPVLEFAPDEFVPTKRELPRIDGPEFALGDVVLDAGVVARGVVRGVDDTPVPGAHVVVYAGDALLRQGETDAAGRFEFAGVPDCELVIEASAPSTDGEWAAPLEGVTAGERATDGDIVVRLSSSLSVFVELVLDADDSVVNVGGLDIEVESLAEPDSKTSQGYYGGEMSSVRVRVSTPGRYRVTVTAQGYAAWTADDVEITESGETRLVARLRPERE